MSTSVMPQGVEHSTEPRQFADLHEQARRVLWSFGLNLPSHPEGDGHGYVCPAENYIECIRLAVTALETAKETALAEIPEQMKTRAGWLEKSHISAVEEMSTVAPEVRRLWAVRAAHDLVGNLYEALQDEAKPHPRVVLPPLARKRREI